MGIVVSGAVISSLIYQFMKYAKVQEGFLIGKLVEITSDTISDSNISNKDTNIDINVTSFLPCVSVSQFYSGSGLVDVEELKRFLGSNFENIIGWYRCRGICSEILVKESMVHRQLLDIFSNKKEHFLIGILSGNSSGATGTMRLEYHFRILRSGNFEPVSVEIVNLKDTSTNQYIDKSTNCQFYSSASVDKNLSAVENCNAGVSEVTKVHKTLLSQLHNLLPKFSEVCDLAQVIKDDITNLLWKYHRAEYVASQSDYVTSASGTVAGSLEPLASRSETIAAESNLIGSRSDSNECHSDESKSYGNMLSKSKENLLTEEVIDSDVLSDEDIRLKEG